MLAWREDGVSIYALRENRSSHAKKIIEQICKQQGKTFAQDPYVKSCFIDKVDIKVRNVNCHPNAQPLAWFSSATVRFLRVFIIYKGVFLISRCWTLNSRVDLCKRQRYTFWSKLAILCQQMEMNMKAQLNANKDPNFFILYLRDEGDKASKRYKRLVRIIPIA